MPALIAGGGQASRLQNASTEKGLLRFAAQKARGASKSDRREMEQTFFNLNTLASTRPLQNTPVAAPRSRQG
jgi:hypothetical protein